MTQEAHVCIPDDLRGRIPPLYATENDPNPTVHVKLFTPDSNWTWYITEFDGEDLCFGYVVGHAAELGYFCLSEIARATGPHGLRIERDVFFEPQPLNNIRIARTT